MKKPEITADNATMLALFDEMKDLHHKMVAHLQHMASRIRDRNEPGDPGQQELTDFGFLCREVGDWADDFRKDCWAHKDLSSRVICLREMEESMANPEGDAGGRIHGSLCSGVTDLKYIVEQPSYGQHEYTLLMRALGIPQNVIDGGMVKCSWDRMNQFATELAEQGIQLPAGLGKKHPQYVVTYTRNRRAS